MNADLLSNEYFAILANPSFWVAVLRIATPLILGTLGLGGLVLLVPPLQRLFSLAPLSLGDVGACLAMAATSVAWFEVVKLGFGKALLRMTQRHQ